MIGRAGVGVDNIELEPATRKGIAVMNTPGGNAIAVAEHTIGLMIAMARFLPKANQGMHEGKWEKKALQGTELRGKTLGIVGLGKIGLETAKRARAFGMEIVAHDPFVSAAIAKDNGIKLGSLDEVFAASDYLSLHVGLTPQTHNMINAESLKKMKKGVRIVNCARGELIDEAALVAALQEGPGCGGGARRIPEGTAEGFSPAKIGQRDSHAPHCRFDQRSPGSRRASRSQCRSRNT